MKKIFLIFLISMLFSLNLFAKFYNCDFSSLAPFDVMNFETSGKDIMIKMRPGMGGARTCTIIDMNDNGTNGLTCEAECNDFSIKIRLSPGFAHTGLFYVDNSGTLDGQWAIQCH